MMDHQDRCEILESLRVLDLLIRRGESIRNELMSLYLLLYQHLHVIADVGIDYLVVRADGFSYRVDRSGLWSINGVQTKVSPAVWLEGVSVVGLNVVPRKKYSKPVLKFLGCE